MPLFWIKCWAIGFVLSAIIFVLSAVVHTPLEPLFVYVSLPLLPAYLLMGALTRGELLVASIGMVIGMDLAVVVIGSFGYGLLVALALRLGHHLRSKE